MPHDVIVSELSVLIIFVFLYLLPLYYQIDKKWSLLEGEEENTMTVSSTCHMPHAAF